MSLIRATLERLERLQWLPILLARLAVGGLFFESGRGKLLYKLDELGEFFTQLGIPFPHFNAVFVSSTELIGGLCLLLGFATRIMSIPLAFIMVIAIATSEIDKANSLGDFLYLPEVFLFVLCVWFIFSGPGKVSIDQAIADKNGLG